MGRCGKPSRGFGRMQTRLRKRARGFRSHARGLPPGDPAADVLLQCADELDAKATELEAKAKELETSEASGTRTVPEARRALADCSHDGNVDGAVTSHPWLKTDGSKQ